MDDSKEEQPMDVSTMRSMSDKEYREYLRAGNVIYLDVHQVLRLSIDGSPLAATREQLDVLIEELRQFRTQIEVKRG